MPVYEYRCDACQGEYELQRKFSDPPLEACPRCGKGPVEKLISRNSFALKGSGWYRTDYALGKSESATPKPKAPSCAGAGSKGCAGCPGAAG